MKLVELRKRAEPQKKLGQPPYTWVHRQARDAILKLGRELNSVDEHSAAWFPTYVAAIVLLRSVGHVLVAEGNKDPNLKKFLGERWVVWKQEEIFKSLIEAPRNELIKEGELFAERTMGVTVRRSGDPAKLDDEVPFGVLFDPRSNENTIDQLWKAWRWWSEKLGEVHRFRRPSDDN